MCYRATSPTELIARQAEGWDPVLDWAATQFGARLKSTAGIMHIAQDAAALDALRGEVLAKSHYELTALHEMVALTGSLILGLAAFHDFSPVTTIWDLSRIDEAWQEEQWGPDEEAQKPLRNVNLRTSFRQNPFRTSSKEQVDTDFVLSR